MELKNNKSALAALATLGVTAVAAGATAFVKIREKRRQQRAEADAEAGGLTAEQLMVYNEAVSRFLALNSRIYDLRRHREALQPLISRLALVGDKPDVTDAELSPLAADIERFLTTQVPFINACLASAASAADARGDHAAADEMTYADCVRGPVGGRFDATLDEEPTGSDVADGAPIRYVLRLGYFFPDSTMSPHPVRSIVLV